MKEHRNRLAHSRSPYLLQHAGNPVDWYPWGPEAFERAATDDKPIFLSIGYSTCHWCHVMEKESFCDPEVARLMNDAFVNIKVDREELPNVDHIYMAVCQHLTGSGGWPLTVVMTPDRRPFFAGTYFPRETRYDRLGMLELVPRLADIWKNNRSQAVHAADEIVRHLARAFSPVPGKTPGRDFLDATFSEISRQFDSSNGGFAHEPKFPNPVYILFLLRYWKRRDNQLALQMVYTSLRTMWRGGIYDQLGHGFHRYATDSRWRIPHFEKMLSDQALLAMAYIEAHQATGDAEFGQAAREILDYVRRDLGSEEGGFFTAEDADSDGEEGRFYTWSWEELTEVLDDKGLELAAAIYNVTTEGNVPAHHSELRGRSVLYRSISLEELSRITGLETGTLEKAIKKLRSTLLKARSRRSRPARDEKILTDMNGLMIAALAKAACAFDDRSCADAAERCADFLFDHMVTAQNGLLHRSFQGRPGIRATLDDYAFLLWGCMELYQATFRLKHLKRATWLAEELLTAFWDEEAGGFFFAAAGEDPLPFRNKFGNDSSTPSGNAVAAHNLLRIARLTANPQYEERVAALGRAFSHQFHRAPAAFAHLASVLDLAFHSSAEVIILGDPSAPDTLDMISALRRTYLPNMVAAFVPTTEPDPEIRRIIPFTRGMQSLANRATAYVCKDFACRSPTTSPREMVNTLKDIERMKI